MLSQKFRQYVYNDVIVHHMYSRYLFFFLNFLALIIDTKQRRYEKFKFENIIFRKEKKTKVWKNEVNTEICCKHTHTQPYGKVLS